MTAAASMTSRKRKPAPGTPGGVLLPWQQAWRRDESRLKLWEKCRRIGATWTEANDAVMSRLAGRREDYWFSSADESAAYEFGEYCRFWLQSAKAVADHFTEQVEDPRSGRAATAFCVRLPNGARITAVSSNPRRFRSKGGDVTLDEFAYHDDPGAMYDAAQPCILWGGRLRILSTHNGDASQFHRFVEMGRRRHSGQSRPGDIPFRLHRITIEEAVAQGLVEKINESRNVDLTRQQFLADCRAGCRNADQWAQEYLAIPSMDQSAWLAYDLIEACESEQAGDPALAGEGLRYVGMDVGENRDRTVIWTLEQVGDVLWTREVLVLTDEPLRIKGEALLSRLRHPRVVRACVDATGLGAQIAQDAVATGKGEAVKFSLPVKDALFSPLRGLFEDRRVRVPADRRVREDLHSLRMVRTSGGSPRFDAARSEAGHADLCTALALACSAARTTTAAGVILL